MRFEPTEEQKNAILILIDWWRKPENPYITLGGYAGTGKTSLLAVYRRLLYKFIPKLRVAFCAYTGKATQVLDSSLRLQTARIASDSVSTIHSLIYAPIVNKSGVITGWRLKAKLDNDLIIVDEASMIDRQIWEDLLRFGIPILAVGDHGQLPPINPGFNLMSRLDIRLETIHRQAADNPIIQLSMQAREKGHILVGDYGMGVRKVDKYDASAGEEVENFMQSGAKELLILAGYNHSRIRLNQQMRQYLGFESQQPQSGDKVICLKNNWEKGIYNGMMGRVTRIESHAGKSYEAEIETDDGNIFEGQILKEQFDSPKSLAERVKKNENIELFDFGYALTVHKAQGRQAKRVLLFEERNRHMSDEDWRRWLYTAVTRAEEELLLVG
jgi:exodeoxyribonuclease-5